MHIILVTPEVPAEWSGNRITTDRWRDILVAQGHSVAVGHTYSDEPADLMIALHAWRSSTQIAQFKTLFPTRPLIVALTGTDAYDYIARDPEPTLRSLRLADRIVALHDLIKARLPEDLHGKVRVIHQSAAGVKAQAKAADGFQVSVIGHLREVKDPMRTAHAARLLPDTSRIRVVQAGAAMTPEWCETALQEMRDNGRYRWLGEIAHEEAILLLASSHALVLSSISEGGANVLSEAAMAGVPVLTSRIDAAVALLGPDYGGYFETGDTTALAALLTRLETDDGFEAGLKNQLRQRAGLFDPALEVALWEQLLDEVMGQPKA